ncbi:MAG: RDD family protein [Acidimicrobiales bacterium]
MIPSDDRTTAIPSGGVLAPIGRRALGAIIDQVLVLVPVAIGVLVSGYEPGTSLTDESLLWLNAISVGVGFAYEAVMIGILGRTVGKIATGTRVVSATTGGRVGWFAAVQRAIVPAVAAAVPEAGILFSAVVYGMAAFGPLRQGLHDRAAGTVVIMSR